ncbi:MAG: nascent polypeptide-associated complex protein [Candidatus Woesearchaeota archaeon]
MIPINQRQMQQAMKRLGVNQKEIDAIAVIIRTKKEDIIIRNPSVQKINMMGQESYQISGEEEIRPLEEEMKINEEDIKTVMEQTNANREVIIETLKKHKGDLASTILELQNR